jgi:hypothetical protein
VGLLLRPERQIQNNKNPPSKTGQPPSQVTPNELHPPPNRTIPLPPQRQQPTRLQPHHLPSRNKPTRLIQLISIPHNKSKISPLTNPQ